ncbi:hypothetical protein ACQCVO_15005 [Bacillus infantis]|uniref:hypothetical protein n=1 Tax=Bacillus infantis TaxID=324767 RepID=UPI003CE8481F
MGNYRDLDEVINSSSNIRILIIDNNNLEFCSQHEDQFPGDKIFENYDVILVPDWVHAEISHSEKRLNYLASINVPYFVMSEEEDYTELVEYQELRLMKLFEHASSSISKARKYFSGLKKYYSQNDDLPEDWISQFYDLGFEIKIAKAKLEGEAETAELRKNAGETSILVLTYLLLHHYHTKIKQITIFSSDKGTLTIKQNIMQHLHKIELIHNPLTSISFKSTDILLIEAYKDGRITLEDVKRIRTNKKSVIYTYQLDDSSSSRHEHVLDTDEFIRILGDIENYHFEF